MHEIAPSDIHATTVKNAALIEPSDIDLPTNFETGEPTDNAQFGQTAHR